MIELEACMATQSWVNREHRRAENAPLWGPSVEDQRGGDVVTYPHHLGQPVRKFRTQLHWAGSRPRVSSLMMS